MAKTPSLNASRRFFLCLIFSGLCALPSRSPPSAPAGSPRGRRRLHPKNRRRAGGPSGLPPAGALDDSRSPCDQAAGVLLVLLGAEGVLELLLLLLREVGADEAGVRALDGGHELVLGHLGDDEEPAGLARRHGVVHLLEHLLVDAGLAPLAEQGAEAGADGHAEERHEEEQAEEHAPEGAAHGAGADQAVAVLDVRLAVRVAHDLGGVAQLHDHVFLQLRELETEPVGLHLVLEAEDHHLAHTLSSLVNWWWIRQKRQYVMLPDALSPHASAEGYRPVMGNSSGCSAPRQARGRTRGHAGRSRARLAAAEHPTGRSA